MQTHPPPVRLHTYHSSKKQLLGNQVHTPPAWRTAPGATASGKKAGPAAASMMSSKILLSQLPTDVVEIEVEALFAKTVGPLRDAFLVYNSQGKSKGMAVITFAKPGDAAIAREKYNGKMIDGRRPIKIEIIKDEDERPSSAPTSRQKSLSLLQRMGQTPRSAPRAPAAQAKAPAKTAVQPSTGKAVQSGPKAQAAQRPIFAANAKARLRAKKGPKRIQKQQQRKVLTAEQLDQEMEDYRASTDEV